jgi:hypothetical protein
MSNRHTHVHRKKKEKKLFKKEIRTCIFQHVGRGIFMRKQTANVTFVNPMKIYESKID